MTTSPPPIVQISRDLAAIEEALGHAHKAVRVGSGLGVEVKRTRIGVPALMNWPPGRL